ncbi:hypothetical protein M9H77_25851 [Catharanthus roseus]|uniref:Uncharacterized protein n=1 Tax=Catharanthus roseus TaxID=4058 RepID=A0ACC0A824_CATRO|nr:hypothetical protein M9H77_25851 [Catharanthus roseus]
MGGLTGPENVGRHNHKIDVYSHGHAQAARLTEEQLKQTETVQEESCAATYNMPFLEAADLTPTRKNFIVATAFMCNEQATSRHIDKNVLAKLTEMVKDKEVATQFVNGSWHKLINEVDEAEYRRKLDALKTRVRTSEVLHFGVETTNRAESKHSILKLWLSTCHEDLDTMFLNIDSVIESQIAEIKSSLEISKLKKKFGSKSNHILKNVSNVISHLALKKKCGHYLRKLHGLLCAFELVAQYEHQLPLKPKDVYIFWKKLEIVVDIPSVHERDMDSEMRDQIKK